MEEKIFCNKCGNEILHDWRFCNYCGAEIKANKDELKKFERITKSSNFIRGIIISFLIIFTISMIINYSNKPEVTSSDYLMEITQVTAIEYLLTKYEDTIKQEVLDSTYSLKKISTFHIADRDIKVAKTSDKEEYFKVTLKGNCIGYWDDFDIKLIQYKFTVTADVYQTGRVKNIQAETEKVR